VKPQAIAAKVLQHIQIAALRMESRILKPDRALF